MHVAGLLAGVLSTKLATPQHRLLSLAWPLLLLQEDFLATVWNGEGGAPPAPAEAPYNGPEAVPAFNAQSTVAVRPDYRCPAVLFHCMLASKEAYCCMRDVCVLDDPRAPRESV
jgi:hypothetical protein